MMPDIVKDMFCPTCGQKLIFKITEEILRPMRFEVPLRLRDGHRIRLDTTHYAESNGAVSRLMLVVVTHCPGENQGDNK